MGIFFVCVNEKTLSRNTYQLQCTCKDFSCDQINITAEFIQINYRVYNLVDYKSFRYVQ